MNKRILFVLGSMKRCGAERVVSILAEQFSKEGNHVNIALLLCNEIDYQLDKAIVVNDLTTRCSRVKSIPIWLLKIRKLIKELNPDILISFVARINILTQIACIGLKKDIVVSERNDPYCDGRGIITKVATKILYPRSKIVVFQTKRSQNYFGKRIRKNSVIILNPVDVQVQAQNIHSKKIVNVGRLSKQKNQKLLLEAFSDIVGRYPEYSLWIYGEGELRKELQKKVDLLGIHDRVFFPGNVRDIHERISDAEIFILCSDYEGLSNALMEALMMGLPCISTNCAGSDEVIENEVNGLLVPVGDREALCAAMDRLISDEELRCKIAENAKRMSEKFRMENIINDWLDVIV